MQAGTLNRQSSLLGLIVSLSGIARSLVLAEGGGHLLYASRSHALHTHLERDHMTRVGRYATG